MDSSTYGVPEMEAGTTWVGKLVKNVEFVTRRDLRSADSLVVFPV
jgi:hypothetical protein